MTDPMTGSPTLTDDLPAPGMRRDLSRWAGTNPAAVAAGSEAQAVFCIADARNDIAVLATALSTARTAREEAEMERDAALDVAKIASDQIDDMLGAIRDGIKRAEAAEERVSALTAELATVTAFRDAAVALAEQHAATIAAFGGAWVAPTPSQGEPT